MTIAATSANEAEVEFAVRLDPAGIRRLYPKVRAVLLDAGYALTATVDVMRVLERLIATSIERDAKRLQVRVRLLENGTHVKVIDRRRLNPRESLICDFLSPDIARTSGANLDESGGLALWAVVDRRSGPSTEDNDDTGQSDDLDRSSQHPGSRLVRVSRSERDVEHGERGAAYKAMSSSEGAHFEFTVRVETAGISHLYARARTALLDVGFELTDTVDVMRALERLIAASIERGSKRLQVRMHTLPKRTHVKVIDRRRLNPGSALPSHVVPREIARASGARPLTGGAGLALWAIVDRRGADRLPAA